MRWLPALESRRAAFAGIFELAASWSKPHSNGGNNRATAEPIKALDSVLDPCRRLELILDAASQEPRSHSLYTALAEASGDKLVRGVLNRARRIHYVESCYRELGFPPPLAHARALLAYAAYRGPLQLAREAPSVLSKDWSTYQLAVRELFIPTKSQQRST